MLKEEVVHHHPQGHLPIEELLGTLSAQLLEYCDSDLIRDTLGRPEERSEPTCRSSDDPVEFCLSPDGDGEDVSAGAVKAGISMIGNEDDDDGGMASLSTIFNAREEDDISASIDFSTSPVYTAAPVTGPEFLSNQSERYDFSAVQQEPQVTSAAEVAMSGMAHFLTNPTGNLVVTQLPSVVDVCLSSMPSCNFFATNDMGISFVHPNGNGASFCSDSSGLVMGSMLGINGEMKTRELDYCRGNGAGAAGIFYHSSQPGMFNPEQMQAIGLESQNLLGGHPTSTPPLATEITNPDDGAATFKVGKLSPEERKEKIGRYIRKRNERNFSKKIKYACRKTLADSRPRVRGRFARNDDHRESSRHGSDYHHEDEYEEEENNPTLSSTTEMYGHGGSSFNCSFAYPIMDLNTFSDTQLGTF